MHRMKTNGGARLLALMLLTAALMALLGTAAAEMTFPFTTVTNDSVNMRRNASSTSVVLERLDEGDSITVLGEAGNYYKIRFNNRTGYVIKQYVSVKAAVTPVPTAKPTATGYPYETTTNSSVNLREKKSTSSDRLDVIPEGARVKVLAVSGNFAQVTYDGQTGYCIKSYVNLLEIVKATPTPKPVPTLSPEENASGYQVLRKGSVGDHVKALQEALIELGFLSGTADGQFGDATQRAVAAFQQKNEYPTTGIVDANLQAFLYSGKPRNAAGKATDVKTLAPVDGVTIRLNDQGEIVRKVQLRLRELGYYTGAVSGVYDKATRSAVTAFQKKNSLTADGICGTQTQAVLLSGSALSATATATPKPTATPTAVPTYTRPSATVRSGSTGVNATLVQQRLKELGYLTGKVDGRFGDASEAALTAFQRKHGLEADGVAGSDTYDILFSYRALAADQLPTAAPTATPAPTPAPATLPPVSITRDNVVLVKQGVRGDAVTRVQQRLTQLGYYTANANGLCKADDVAAIKAFQRMNGLAADGVAGYDTQVKLFSASAKTAGGAIAGGTVESFSTLRKGMSGPEVENLQLRLKELGYLTGTADGKYGTATAEAVYNFQKANGLSRDGVAGSATLSRLYSATALAPTPAPTAKPTAAPSGSTGTATLRKGDVSNAVKSMQELLIRLGYLSGKADGKFGVQTYRALVNFQKANSLDADGIAGAMTLAKLNSSSAIANGQSKPTATPTPNIVITGTTTKVTAANVQYVNWYSSLRAKAKKYPYATVYDFSSGLSWQVHMFSFGAHADAEPLTAADTARMERAFGGNTWNPKPVWVVLGDGSIYIASTHSMPHAPQHRTDNNFDGHMCIHFPRTSAQVAAIGTYATSHQKSIDNGWKTTQSMIR